MLETHFSRLRSDVGDAVRQPDFATVRGRARRVRRRRAVTASSAALLVTVLTISGLGYATRTGPVASPPPVVNDGRPRMGLVVSAGSTLYSIVLPCDTCAMELHASGDGGDTWLRRAEPPEATGTDSSRLVSLFSLGRGILAWNVRTVAVDALATSPPTPSERLWVTLDGARSWHETTIDTEPVDVVPAGTQPVDCDRLNLTSCRVAAVSATTGRFAPLATQPTGITVLPGWQQRVNVPLDGRIWVPGVDPATKKPAVASSSDAGRTWETHVFTDGVPAVLKGGGRTAENYLPQVAAGPDGTAYAMTYRSDGVVDVRYTADGGKAWSPAVTLREFQQKPGFVAADGTHIVTTGAGLLAGRAGGRYEPVSLPGYPAEPRQTQVTSRDAAEPYLVLSPTEPYLSRDGLTWRRIPLP
ncbi:sialidase family protein [Actinoplanes sp. NPDC024001]|uniref:sialidase family protein n=1 Tax=Actinoplanes sp. NPDC024001 TaxID=3154598 RepID=UPI0033FFE31E